MKILIKSDQDTYSVLYEALTAAGYKVYNIHYEFDESGAALLVLEVTKEDC